MTRASSTKSEARATALRRRENRVRYHAKKHDLTLHKSRTKDVDSNEFGTYRLIVQRTGRVFSEGDLAEIERDLREF